MNSTDALVARLVDLEARRADIDDTIAQLKAAIIAEHGVGDPVLFHGEPMYKVAQRRTFDAKTAADTLPAEVIEAATVSKIDGAAVKRISPALWETCCTLSEPFLTKATGR